jgi:hypothetical protein
MKAVSWKDESEGENEDEGKLFVNDGETLTMIGWGTRDDALAYAEENGLLFDYESSDQEEE